MDPGWSTNRNPKPRFPAMFSDDPRFDIDLLQRFDFDASRCVEQMEAVHSHKLNASDAQFDCPFEAPEDIAEIKYDDGAEEREAHRAGVRALTRGQIAVLVLNGGLATRFGGVVKGTVEVFDNISFLGAKITDLIRAKALFAQQIPLLVMNSFATRDETAAHLQKHSHFGIAPEDVEFFDQSISVRLTEEGDPFFGADGQARYYAPGHGEFFQRLHACGLYLKMVSRGIRYLLFSNIDNLGATIDPLLLGTHIMSNRDMTVELVRKTRNASGAWDVGGAPVRVGKHVQVVEGFRFPASLPPEALPDFQTNNMYFSLQALREPPSLPRYKVTKQVEGRASIGFEAVTCEASGVLRPNGEPWLSLNLVRVPREGHRGRFYPVKSREDLEAMRARIKDRLYSGWALRDREAGG